MEFLNRVNEPKDIKNFKIKELKQLSNEIRTFLIDKVSRTGGHLASNLGVVELTLALHRVFDTPTDKIIWDVGHQAYTHKILTGRRDAFDTLRQFNGLSGFPDPEESCHDEFRTGHSSTSISAGIGMARARDLLQEHYHVISVIGDAALSGGMAFEALNDAGSTKTKLIVVLNDNEMSISQNVGSLSTYLGKLRMNPNYINFRDDVENLVKKIPTIGEPLFKNTHKFKESLKYFFVQGMLFEELGFKYLGPIDGHDLPKLMDAFSRAKRINGPVLIHVLTQKGKGYPPAEKNPDLFHGIGPFDIQSGKKERTEGSTYSSVFGEEMMKEAEMNAKLVAITAAMPDGTGLAKFAAKFPNRFFDVGIAEQHGATLAAGMAATGLKPVFAVYSTFLQRAFDQVIHDICIQKLNVLLAIDRAGIVGDDGETHQGIMDISFLRMIPNLMVLSPKDQTEFRYMLKWCFEHSGPTAIRYPRGGDGDVCFEKYEPIEEGRWELLQEGQGIVLLATGRMTQTAYKVAELLRESGIAVTLANCRFIKPLDIDMLKKIFANNRMLFTFEDNYIAGGFGSAVNEAAAVYGYKGSIKNLGFPDQFIEHGSRELLYEKYKLDAVSLYENILRDIEGAIHG